MNLFDLIHGSILCWFPSKMSWKTNQSFLMSFLDKIQISSLMTTMAILVVEFSREGYKIRMFFGKNSTYPKTIIEFCELV